MVRVVKAKGSKRRRVPLDSGSLSELCTYISDNAIDDDLPIFPISQQWATIIVRRYGRLIDRDIHPHTFRHSYAINMVRHGCDIRRVQLLLGRANLNTMQVYLQFWDSDKREAYHAVAF